MTRQTITMILMKCRQRVQKMEWHLLICVVFPMMMKNGIHCLTSWLFLIWIPWSLLADIRHLQHQVLEKLWLLTVTDLHPSITTLQEQVPSDSRPQLWSQIPGTKILHFLSVRASVRWQMRWMFPDGMHRQWIRTEMHLQDVILSIIQKMEFSPEKWLQTQWSVLKNMVFTHISNILFWMTRKQTVPECYVHGQMSRQSVKFT